MSQTKWPSDPFRLLFGAENSAIWLVAIVGLSLSFAALLLIRQQLDAHKMLDFEWVAHNRIRALRHGLDNSMLAVTALRDHVIVSGRVDAEEFRVFAESLLDRYRGVQALLWVPLVNASERRTFEASIVPSKTAFRILERAGHAGLVPAVERAEYFPVRHVAPDHDDSIPAGFDLGSIPSFAETLSRARDLGRMAASGRIAYPLPLPQGGLEYGFMVASPVVGGRSFTVQTAEPHRATLTGFIVGFSASVV